MSIQEILELRYKKELFKRFQESKASQAPPPARLYTGPTASVNRTSEEPQMPVTNLSPEELFKIRHTPKPPPTQAAVRNTSEHLHHIQLIGKLKEIRPLPFYNPGYTRR
jgi:hypothetical protein